MTTPVPDRILRLQRRNALRAGTPVSSPPHALLDESGQGKNEKEAAILDISASGMCLLIDQRALPLVAGTRIVRVRFELTGLGEILCGLEVRYILSAGASHPEYMRRCGARFVQMGSGEELLIARYVNALERERARPQGAAESELLG